jgi:hypothetical protein
MMAQKNNKQPKATSSAFGELSKRKVGKSYSDAPIIPILELDLFSLSGLLLTGQVKNKDTLKQSMEPLCEDVSTEHKHLFEKEVSNHE